MVHKISRCFQIVFTLITNVEILMRSLGRKRVVIVEFKIKNHYNITSRGQTGGRTVSSPCEARCIPPLAPLSLKLTSWTFYKLTAPTLTPLQTLPPPRSCPDIKELRIKKKNYGLRHLMTLSRLDQQYLISGL